MPKVKLRSLTRKEKELLNQRLGDKTLSVRIYERYRVIAEAAQKRSPMEIADRTGCHWTSVYDWIHEFNKEGFSNFERITNPNGRPAAISSAQIRQLIKTALSHPEDMGLPFTEWSIAKLHDYCKEKELLPSCSDEWVRRLLRREGITYQRTKTWKKSPDPDFEVKKTAFSNYTRKSLGAVS